MERVIDNIAPLIEKSKNIERTNNVDGIKKQLQGAVGNALDKVINYTIKALPIPEPLKDITLDIKESFKTKDFKEILKTVINSSIREGLEILGLDENSIKGIMEAKNIAIKGGLIQGIKATVDMNAKRYINGNLFGNDLEDIFNNIVNSVMSKDFKDKLDKNIQNITKKTDDFLNKCKEWYKAYEKMDYNEINKLAESIKKESVKVKADSKCIKESNIIQNITALVNNKKDKLSEAQLQFCKII
ncbi:MAG: hypothetical protein PHR25_00670 [Clostridia bacterium]|nr:hypothetical protein [Clostridia bacterium]MDD4375281.1 hypothetical protein [Clostridia bacterium]